MIHVAETLLGVYQIYQAVRGMAALVVVTLMTPYLLQKSFGVEMRRWNK